MIFQPKNADMHDLLTGWLSFLKNPVFMDESFLEVPEVHDAMDTLKYMSADDDARAIADLRQRTINDKNSEITVARNEGLVEGELKKARESAVNLLSIGLGIKQISAATGLPIFEIESLKT